MKRKMLLLLLSLLAPDFAFAFSPLDLPPGMAAHEFTTAEKIYLIAQAGFLFISVGCLISSIVFLILWIRNRKTSNKKKALGLFTLFVFCLVVFLIMSRRIP